MNNRDDLEEILKTMYERRAQALMQQLDGRLSRVLKAPEHRPARQLLKPALALVSLAMLWLGAWFYDLSQSGSVGPVVLDARFEHPQIVLQQPGDPVALTRQIAGLQSAEPSLRLVEPGLNTSVFRFYQEIEASLSDSWGNRFVLEESGRIAKRTLEDEEIKEEIVLEGLDHPNGLAFDRDGSLLVLESGKGRILRVEPVEGEIRVGSPVSVLAEGFGKSVALREDLSERMMRREHRALELGPEESVKPVYLTVSEQGEVFVGGQTETGEAVVYKIERKSFKWWKFYCFYQC